MNKYLHENFTLLENLARVENLKSLYLPKLANNKLTKKNNNNNNDQ